MKLLKLSLARSRALRNVALACAIAGALSTLARATVVDLGAADGFSILTYNSNNTSDSAFQGGNIGVVNGSWTQSGGGQTNTQQPTTVFLSSSSFSNKGPSQETTVINPGLLNSAWSSAVSASANFASQTATQTFGAITTGQTITGTAGTNVIDISSIKLNQAALTLSGSASSSFIVNVSGDVKLDGGSKGNGLLLTGGVTANNVVFNILNGSSVTTTGGGNAQDIQGIVLDTAGSVNLHPGEIDGEVVAQTFTSSSGALISTTPMVPVPETNSAMVLGPLLGFILLFSSKRMNLLGSLLARRREATI